MGGLVCHAVRVSVLQFPSVPTDPSRILDFDRQMRQLYANPIIADSLGVDAADKLPQAIAILSKPTWTVGDRTTLYDIVESLY
jgi:hypothetical protein